MQPRMIVAKFSKESFKNLVKKYSNNIVLSYHSQRHLSESQRKVFKADELIKTVESERPVFVGIQGNHRISVWYKRKNGYLRIILETRRGRLFIVTFTNSDTLPNVR